MRILIISLLIIFSATISFAQSPIGKWKTIDDETKEEKSILEIYKQDGKLYAKVIQLFREPDEEQNPLCDECSGDRKNKPILGMVIMWDMEKDDDQWEGKILDPENGKTYSCYIEMEEDNKLKVRGYVGFSLLGRTQYWYRQ